jgi:hypothetical protein
VRVFQSARFGEKVVFCRLIGVHCYFADWSALLFCRWSAKFILPIGVQNLFCDSLECKIYFAIAWSAKFILR